MVETIIREKFIGIQNMLLKKIAFRSEDIVEVLDEDISGY